LDHRPTGASSTGFFVGFNSSRNLRFNQGSTDHISDSGTVDLGQWYHIAVSRASGTTKMFKNGTQVGSNYSDTNNYTSSTLEIGQRSTSNGNPFDGWITNVRIVLGTALYTSNFTSPTAALTAVSGTALLIGGGDTPLVDQSSNNISFTQVANPVASEFGPFTGSDGEGGLVWTKIRTQTDHNYFWDTERGVNKRLTPNSIYAQQNETDALNSFNSNGFTMGSAGNINGDASGHWGGPADYVSWTFRNSPMFQCLSFTGDGSSSQTISHNLKSVPGMIICKKYDANQNWYTYHRGINGGTNPEQYWIELDGTGGAQGPNANFWNNTAPTSTQFTVGSAFNGNYVAYLFAHNNNDGGFGPDRDQDIIKCGSYTGNTSGDLEINVGFEPQWVLIKNASASRNWQIVDIMRGFGNEATSSFLAPSNNSAENADLANIAHLTSTGFKLDQASGQDFNENSNTFIYMAIRRGPLAVPDDATKVFKVDNGDGSSVPAWSSGFPVDMAIERSIVSDNTRISSRLTGTGFMYTDTNDPEYTNQYREFDYMDGWWSQAKDSNAYSWMWKRAPSYFDVVAYTGNNTSGHTINHNLGAVPEMMWVKRRSLASDWKVYHSALGNTKHLNLNESIAAATDSSIWNDTTPTASIFTLGYDIKVNGNGDNHIAYLFATVAGVSKVGSVSHTNGTDTNVSCGFSSGARFILIKRTDGASSWYVFDTVRGIVAGDDKGLYLQSNLAEQTGDWIDPFSSGFTMVGASFDTGSYIFYAIA